MAIRVLAVDDNAINLKVVSVTLQHTGYEVFTAVSGPLALELAAKVQPDIILLDITMPDMDGYEVCRRLRSNPATVTIPIIMLTAHDTLEEKIKGFDSGADDYLTKPFQPAELQARIKVLLRRGNSSFVLKEEVVQTKGKVIAAFSLRGGVGVSTVATNLACAFSQLWGSSSVVLVDLALTIGQSALMLNLPLKNTWANLTKFPLEDLDTDVVESVLIHHASGISVLAAPRSVADGELITPDLVKKVLGFLQKRFRYLVLDLPHDFRETSMIGFDFADQVVALLSPELASVRAMSGALEVFDTLNYKRENVQLVMNWIFEKRGLAKKDIENALHQQAMLEIPFSPELMVTAINLGNPPVLSAPNSPVSTLFEDFAYFLSREDDLSHRPVNPTDIWKRAQERDQTRRTIKR